MEDALQATIAEKKGVQVGKRRLSSQDMCTIAFGTSRQRSSLAERFDVSRNTIRRVSCFSALTVLEAQLKQLRDLCDFSERSNPDVRTALLQALAENGNSSLYPSALSRRSQSKPSFHVSLLPLCVAARWGPCKQMGISTQ